MIFGILDLRMIDTEKKERSGSRMSFKAGIHDPIKERY